MQRVIVTGETIEEALDEGLEKLDAKRDEVNYDVLEEPKDGFLGIFGRQIAKLEVTKQKSKVEKALVFLEELLEEMDLGFEVELVENRVSDNEAIFNISGDDLGIIIGHRGNTLDSLQYLTNLAVNKGEKDYLHVALDAEGYRQRRKQTLKNLALKLAKKSKKEGRQITLDPMPPHERKIIHKSLQKVSGVATQSKGQDPNRKVVINAS
ncbi:putative RNA-binding protein [Halobacteroides halobius DSM 5150]|uniref:RNA-binding protein KhpB n=1 Tax=Halobacteroides halobius (strain ATCC 35273 / DSM 5150 / MD-1) TaxID=748449 RepID=L0KEK8_HALHC|nr:RNA-binding cell elongation regulator Jag/EloR [Halobacteroides halobius]AGB42503.1 putative RNA-binding protein [Halobacteroides halobius DSM 5150]